MAEIPPRDEGSVAVQASSAVVWGRPDERWFDAVNHFSRHTPWLHTPARLYAEYGVVLFACLLGLSWWQARGAGDLRRVGNALCAPIGALIALGVNQFLAAAVAEPRPYSVLPHVLVLVSRSTDYSFPSDHAVMAGAVAVGVLMADRRLGVLTTALAVLMALIRVYVGAHFPADVAAGLLVGAGVCLTSCLLVRPMVVRVVVALVRTPLGELTLWEGAQDIVFEHS
jgi:membrane-associated phospholipid phosphatase